MLRRADALLAPGCEVPRATLKSSDNTTPLIDLLKIDSPASTASGHPRLGQDLIGEALRGAAGDLGRLDVLCFFL